MSVFSRIYRYPLWSIPVIMVVGIVFYVVIYRKCKMTFLRRFNAVIFLLSIIGILRFTVLGRSFTDERLITLQPFISFQYAKVQPEFYRTMVMNTFLFFPFGLSMPFVLPEKCRGKLLLTLICAFLFSTGIELIQYFGGLGYCEVDDIICNTLGGLIGSMAYHIHIILQKNSI